MDHIFTKHTAALLISSSIKCESDIALSTLLTRLLGYYKHKEDAAGIQGVLEVMKYNEYNPTLSNSVSAMLEALKQEAAKEEEIEE